MRKEASLPVRLDADEKKQLQRIAHRAGTNISALIRLLVSSFVDDVERGDGRVSLPPDWIKLLRANLDNVREAAEQPGSYLDSEPRNSSANASHHSADGAGH